MNRQAIPIAEFLTQPYSLWEKSWLLLSSGDFTIGADRWVNDQLVAGLAASYHSADINLTTGCE